MPRIPRSSDRRKPNTFSKLLSGVDPGAVIGFGFKGRFFLPGAQVEESDLWPTSEYPQGIATLLECAGSTGLTANGQPARGHNRSEVLFILWRYQDGVWTELGRARSVSWHWGLELRSMAIRALSEARQVGNADVLPSLEAVTSRIALFLGRELDPLEPRDRMSVLGILHDQFAYRLAELQG